MNVLLPIKTKYVNQMIIGNKLYEFRKHTFKKPVEYIYIYQTSPVMTITHRFKVTKIITDTPSNIWNKFKDVSGMDKDSFFKYYEGKKEAVAIKVDDLRALRHPMKLSDFNIKHAPQSFKYID